MNAFHITEVESFCALNGYGPADLNVHSRRKIAVERVVFPSGIGIMITCSRKLLKELSWLQTSFCCKSLICYSYIQAWQHTRMLPLGNVSTQLAFDDEQNGE